MGQVDNHPSLDRLLQCWGKTSKKGPDDVFHPALYHMVDVASVSQVLLQPPSSARWGNVISQVLGLESANLSAWLPGLIALHDVGKISSAFQAQLPPQAVRLRALGFELAEMNLYHAPIGQVFIDSEGTTLGILSVYKCILRDVIGGHHGQFTSPLDLKQTRLTLLRYEPKEWREMRKATAEILLSAFGFHPPIHLLEPRNMSAAIMAITGFTILCDWLGSDEDYFPPASGIPFQEYLALSRERAHQVVEWAGFHEPSVSLVDPEFQSVFPGLATPRPTQLAIDNIPETLFDQPCMAIIEAPTGEGKTEAALALAHRIARKRNTDEFYYALPTTATSNQMHARVQKFLYGNLNMPVLAKLVHSQAFLLEDTLQIVLPTYGEENQPAALDWFGPKKKALLASYGVGTIDQAELGALNVRHAALRLIGLAGKVLIIDEVHAYDVYMTTIIERLLSWLAEMGTSVILLSATLPEARRATLLRAYSGNRGEVPFPSNYPGVTVINQKALYHASPQAAQPEKKVDVSFIQFSPGSEREKAQWLVERAGNEGCVCWIANTVGRAQRIYQEIIKLVDQDVACTLIHSRFSVRDRQRLEKEIGERYGPEGNRPARGIVIGTQVLEQSLDLDFDLMVSDIAPVDLLLQRAGRLHRHNRPRPTKLSVPHLWIAKEIDGEGELNLKTDSAVYAEYILRQTWNALVQRVEINLPDDYRTLIETVYNAPVPMGNDDLARSYQELLAADAAASEKALMRLLPIPDVEESFCAEAARLIFEESETSASWIVAQTRLGEASLNIIPLIVAGSDTARCQGMDGEIQMNRPASREAQIRLLQQSMRVSQRHIVEALKREERPILFSESDYLRDYFPLWLEGNQARVPTRWGMYTLTLDPLLGLVIRKE